MYKNNKLIYCVIAFMITVSLLFASCSSQKIEKENINEIIDSANKIEFDVEPETFMLSLKTNDTTFINQGNERMQTNNMIEKEKYKEWEYPSELNVKIYNKEDYISVELNGISNNDSEFSIKAHEGDAYYIPFGEGNYIPSNDKNWIEYLNGNQYSVIEGLSMPFFAVSNGEYAIVYIIENPYRTDLKFVEDNGLKIEVMNKFENIDSAKQNNIRIYITNNDAVSISKVYKNFILEKGEYITLAEKAVENDDIEKLYGSPFIYLWAQNIISPNDINWNQFKLELNKPILSYVKERMTSLEEYKEILQVFNEIAVQDYVNNFQKNIIASALTNVLKNDTFYNKENLPKTNEKINLLVGKGIDNLSQTEIIELNKEALFINTDNVFKDVDTWNNEGTVDLIKDMKDSGIENAWIGLDSWENAFYKPELVETAVEEGYLIGPYDSYHSIHEPNNEEWLTAKFDDNSLYEKATIVDKGGKKESGFQNVGRKLNPTLSLTSVKKRVKEISSNDIKFNSWFIDCDATGEIYDDYSVENRTTKQEDLKSRLERMAYIRDEMNMVIGSEGGNDFAASTIAFAHGIELETFSWMDEDMSRNKESEYYLGRYFSATGGVPEKFGKTVPIKEKFKTLFLDMSYQVPLFKLVYNDSIITSYHWDWSTLKIKDEVSSRMIREILYNVPPMYHLDSNIWEENKEIIIAHNKIWSDFSKTAIQNEMTDFNFLTEDRLVQTTSYGENLKTVANFTDTNYTHENTVIPSKSVLIIENGNLDVYTAI